MSKVYKCDRCGAEGNFREKDENKVFSEVIYARCLYGDKGNTIHLCPHCMKKFEEFLSDPNCMETVEKDDMELDDSEKEVHQCGTCEWQYSSIMCPRAQSIMNGATITCFNAAIACDKWKPKEVKE